MGGHAGVKTGVGDFEHGRPFFPEMMGGIMR
jgi:hypothetical protein